MKTELLRRLHKYRIHPESYKHRTHKVCIIRLQYNLMGKMRQKRRLTYITLLLHLFLIHGELIMHLSDIRKCFTLIRLTI